MPIILRYTRITSYNVCYTKLLRLEGINEGDAILIENANAPKKFKDRIHLALSKLGKISKIESDLPKMEELLKKSSSKRNDFSRKSISELTDGMGAEIRGLIVSIHSKDPYFPVCDKCNKKMTLKKGYAICKCGNKIDRITSYNVCYTKLLRKNLD